jgi:hypothetical protein
MRTNVFRVSLLAAFVALLMAMGSPAFAKKGDTAFKPQPTGNIYRAGGGPIDVVNADFNNDGARDIVTANNVSNDVSFSLGSGAGAFSAARNFKVGGKGPISLASGDYNQDGKLDVAVANSFLTPTGETTNQGTVSIVPSRTKATADRTRLRSPPGGVASLLPRRVLNGAGTSASQSLLRSVARSRPG